MNANIQVVVDEEEIKKRIKEQVDEVVRQQLLFVDINRLEELTTMKARFLEDRFLNDPRVKIHERRYARKRWWKAKEVIRAIEEITDSW